MLQTRPETYFIGQRLCLIALAMFHVGCGHSATTSSSNGGGNQRESAKPVSAASQLLVDVTKSAGIGFLHHANRTGDYLFPEICGAGCAFLDFDNDGLLDIYLVQGGAGLRESEVKHSNRLFHNQGNGTFQDVTEQSGAGDFGYGQGVACGDFNRDGFVDIYVANVGPSKLLENNGDGTFADVTDKAGVANGHWAIAPAFVDYDNDGWLDLLATNYVDWTRGENLVGRTKSGQPDYVGPRSFDARSAILFRNNRDGTFTDVSKEAGIDKAFGAAMGIICADFDDDHLVDIFVANDSWPNQLWSNQGNGTFQDVGLEQGCAVSGMGLGQASMGTNAEDLDGDGRLDLFTTNYHDQGAILYLQRQVGLFTDVSMRVGLFGPTAARTGFGACFFDLFNDGNLCVYIGNGAAVVGGEIDSTDGYSQSDMILKWSAPTGRFTDMSHQVGSAMDVAYTTRGVAVGDYDNDGAVDLLISNNDGPARLLRNNAAGNRHWLMVRCLDANVDCDVIGAKVYVTVAGNTRRRDVVVNHSYASSSDPRVHFGLGTAKLVEQLRVVWPGGLESKLNNVAADQVLVVRRPE